MGMKCNSLESAVIHRARAFDLISAIFFVKMCLKGSLLPKKNEHCKSKGDSVYLIINKSFIVCLSISPLHRLRASLKYLCK